MEEQFRQLQQQIDKLETKKIQEVEAKANAALDASKKTFASQFNPAISLGIDTIGSYKSNAQGFNPGNGPQAGARINNTRPAGADFNLRSAELFISADVDPFTRAYATINASADAANNDEATLAVEEAAIVTTRLPYNLTVRGGRFFADFGTLPHRHDHDLPFVDRPPSIAAFVGGEAQTNGVEVSGLAPSPFFLRASGTVGNELGAHVRDALRHVKG